MFDDAAPAAAAHARKQETDEIERGRQVDRERAVPCLGRKRRDGREVAHHRVVDEDVGHPALRLHLFDQAGNAFVGRQVGMNVLRL